LDSAGLDAQHEAVTATFLYLMRNGYSSGTIVTVDGGSVLV
jgi:hypothetical protein